MSTTQLHRGVEYTIAIVLLISAVMKARALVAVSQIYSGYPFGPADFIPLLIGLELLMSGWLFLGGCSIARDRCVVGLFSVFAITAGIEAIYGRSDCGCFGIVKVRPPVTFAFDVLAVIALYAMRAEQQLTAALRAKAVRLVGWMLLIFCIVLITKVASAPDGASADAALPEPSALVNQQLVLLDNIEGGSAVKRGRWLLVFYHYDCDECLEAIPNYCAIVSNHTADVTPHVAFIPLPPIAPRGQDPVPDSAKVLRLKLAKDPEWTTGTPIVLAVQDGRVQAAITGADAIRPPIVPWR